MNLVGNTVAPSTLYYGDCLDVMRRWDPGQVDLIYLDPPFNSNQNYNVLFGKAADRGSSQFMAFSDTWQWDGAAADRVRRLKGVGGGAPGSMSRLVEGLEFVLDHSGMLAYVSYMAERMAECRRVLRNTGSIYLHCDQTASHYLKVMMDGIFGKEHFRNEVVWCYGLGGSSRRYWSKKHDVILFYARSSEYFFDKPTMPAKSNRMKGETKGMLDYWTDIPSINNMSRERIGYPTQKPIALLERIVRASSREGDLVLDPFCGCGTTMVGAERLNRRWAGIDSSAFAVDTVMKQRFRKVDVAAHAKGIPVDMEGARALAG